MLWATHRKASTDCLKPHLGRRSSDAPVVEIEFQIIENTFSGLKCENLEIRLLCHGRCVFTALYIGAYLLVVFLVGCVFAVVFCSVAFSLLRFHRHSTPHFHIEVRVKNSVRLP